MNHGFCRTAHQLWTVSWTKWAKSLQSLCPTICFSSRPFFRHFVYNKLWPFFFLKYIYCQIQHFWNAKFPSIQRGPRKELTIIHVFGISPVNEIVKYLSYIDFTYHQIISFPYMYSINEGNLSREIETEQDADTEKVKYP